LNLLNYLV